MITFHLGRLVVVVAATTMLTSAILTSGCERQKGPAEKAGEKLDRAKDKVSDTIDPKGPVEKAGRAMDRATGN